MFRVIVHLSPSVIASNGYNSGPPDETRQGWEASNCLGTEGGGGAVFLPARPMSSRETIERTWLSAGLLGAWADTLASRRLCLPGDCDHATVLVVRTKYTRRAFFTVTIGRFPVSYLPMAQKQSQALTEDRPQPLFVTTRWSVVLAARDKGSPDAAQALEKLKPPRVDRPETIRALSPGSRCAAP
jgi:hypothetical protein